MIVCNIIRARVSLLTFASIVKFDESRQCCASYIILSLMCECNVKILYVVGVAGVSGRNARAAAKGWHPRKWYEGRRSSSTTSRVSRALFAPGNWTPAMNFISWKIENSFASPITSRRRRKVGSNSYVIL